MLGETLSHYRVLETLGTGGMGVVYKAEDLRLGRLVALKMISDTLAGDPVTLERFQREARTASALNHPNICTIYEVDAVEGKPFLVMELLDGRTLHECELIDQKTLLDLATEFTDALATAHAAHIIHRDLKPANLFLTRLGHLKILDFGLAKLLPEGEVSDGLTVRRDLTGDYSTLGTIAYMSPEQARGEPLDARTDLFSFGSVLYELATGARAFGASSAAMTFDAILHGQPVPPRRLRPDLDPGLEQIIFRALEKNRDLRYQSAAEIRADLLRLKERITSGASVSIEPREKSSLAVRAAMALVVLAIAGIVALAVWYERPARVAPPQSAAPQVKAKATQATVAVLPFANLGANPDSYLTLALPDELITILSHSRSLAVRPFAMTRRFTADVDPQSTGQTLKVGSVITGHFRESGGRLGVTLEAIDVEKNNVVWRDSVEAPSRDLLGIREQIAAHVESGLFPVLNAVAPEAMGRPNSREAYELFLRASAMPNEPVANKRALPMLERAVALDPAYAPAWNALAGRWYIDGQWSNGGRAAIQRATAAASRALELDPDLSDAAKRLIVIRTEQGELPQAYAESRKLLRRHAESASAHFAVSYVLRYAGLLNESARECELTRGIDPRNTAWRSCGVTFLYLGDVDRTRQFLDLDRGSAFANMISAQILLRSGHREEALRIVQNSSSPTELPWIPVLRASVEKRPQNEIDAAAAEEEKTASQARDPELIYFGAEILGYAGQHAQALSQLRQAVHHGYCAVPAMDTDPAFAQIRTSAEFLEIHRAATDCQARVLAVPNS